MTSKKKKYIPGLAQFYFKVRHDWSIDAARNLYDKTTHNRTGILNADCVKTMSQMETKSVDLVIADPPFGLNFDGKNNAYNRDRTLVEDGYIDIAPEDYSEFSFRWINELPRIMNKFASAYIFSGWNNLYHILDAIEQTEELTVINHLIWEYNFGVFTKKKYVDNCYHVIFLVKDPDNYFFNKIEWYPQSVFHFNRIYKRGLMKNGTCLPLEVVQRCIDFSSMPGDLVFDPFMGNGTTAMTAKANFRHYYGTELNPNVMKLIQENIELVQLGEMYTPYNDRLPSTKELAKKYPRAYKEFCRRAEKLTSELNFAMGFKEESL